MYASRIFFKLSNCVYSVDCSVQGRPQDLVGGGGGKNFIFQIFKYHAKPCALLGGFGGMLPREIFQNGAIWCVLVYILIRFCFYKISKITIFYIKRSLKCAVNTRVGVEWEQPLLTKCPNGYAPHTASDSKVLTLPSRGGTVSTNGKRRKARHWRSNQLLWTDGVHQLKRQFI